MLTRCFGLTRFHNILELPQHSEVFWSCHAILSLGVLELPPHSEAFWSYHTILSLGVLELPHNSEAFWFYIKEDVSSVSRRKYHYLRPLVQLSEIRADPKSNLGGLEYLYADTTKSNLVGTRLCPSGDYLFQRENKPFS